MYVGSERKQRALSNKLVGDNLEVELGLFSFQFSNSGVKILTSVRGSVTTTKTNLKKSSYYNNILERTNKVGFVTNSCDS